MVAACLCTPVLAQPAIPTVNDMAQAVAEPGTRQQALFAIISVGRYLEFSGQPDAGVQPGSIQENMDWLRKLAGSYGANSLHAPVLDPAAWFIRLELAQRQLGLTPLTSPLGPDLGHYLRFVFDRTDERLASAMLDEMMWQAEPWSTVIWANALERMQTDEALTMMSAEALAALDWMNRASQAEQGLPKPGKLLGLASESLEAMARLTLLAGPPDPARLTRLRYTLLASMPTLESDQQVQAAAFLRLASLVDGLHRYEFIAFSEGLLFIVSEQLEMADENTATSNPVLDWLTRILPDISTNYARDFAQVDPRLNSVLAAAFDVVKDLSRPPDSSLEQQALRRQLADAVAQLTMLIPDLGYYFNLPVRDSIAGGMDACTGLIASREKDGSASMTRELFDDCQQSIVELADTEARAAALSGDMNGPFGNVELVRELSVTSGQRINYGIGYLHSRYQAGCSKPVRPLPNPLEWSSLATLLAWFAEQSPVYFQTPENEARLQKMRRIGREILDVVAQQVDCIAGAGATVNDPVVRSLLDYRQVLVALSADLNNEVAEYRRQTLAPGADVALQKDASQVTAYRPKELMIGPCDPVNVCEMNAPLTSTRALLGLFPDEFLIADQTGLGKVEICYENMEWVQRRSELVRPDDTNVANYFAHLAFDLKGRYVENSSLTDVFEFRFTSPNEHHYLFGPATEEVLADSCPVEWIGQRIVTRLKDKRMGIVPDRLTYLAAPRMLPSRLLSMNWDHGAEWRDWFITGIGVDALDTPELPDISGRLNQHLKELYRAEQAAMYQKMLSPSTGSDRTNTLFNSANQLTTIKSLLRQQLTLFYPQLLLQSDPLRSAVVGQGGLVDARVLARFSVENVPIKSVNEVALERLRSVQAEWARQAETIRRTGSISGSLAHAMMRLSSLYATFFAPAPIAVPEPDTGQ